MSHIKSLIAAATLTLVGGVALAQSSYSVAQQSSVTAQPVQSTTVRTPASRTQDSTTSYSVSQVTAAAPAPRTVVIADDDGDSSFDPTESYSVTQMSRAANGFKDTGETQAKASTPRVASANPATVR